MNKWFEAMFDDIFSSRVANLGALSLLLVVALWRRYTARRDDFIARNKRENSKGTPSTFPYVFPLVGSLPIKYLWKPRAFVLDQK